MSKLLPSEGYSSMTLSRVPPVAKEPTNLLPHDENLFQTIFGEAPIGLAQVALDGSWLRINKKLSAILGYTEEELLTKTFQDITHPDDLDEDMAYVEQLLAGKMHSYSMHKRYRKKQGDFVWGKLTVNIIRDQDDEPVCFISAVENISTLVETQQALRQSEERYRRVVEDQTDPICRYTPGFVVTFANRPYAAMHGCGPAELIGQTLLEDLVNDDVKRVKACLATLSPTNRTTTQENLHHLPNDVQRWYHWTHRVIVDDNGTICEYQSVGRDITERKKAEAAEHKQRLLAEALRDALIAVAESHDIDDVMSQILTSAAAVVPHQTAAIVLFEEGKGRIAYLHGFTPAATARLLELRFPLPGTIYTTVQQQRQPQLLQDMVLLDDASMAPVTVPGRSAICVPIFWDQHVAGALVVQSGASLSFQHKDMNNLQLFAAQAGLALKNLYHTLHLEKLVAVRTHELSTSKEQLEAILDHSPNAKVLLDADFRVKRTNRVVQDLFRCTSTSELLNRSIFDLFTAEDAAVLQSAMARTITIGAVQQVEVQGLRMDGTIFIAELNIGKVKQGSFVCTMRDVTERKEYERTLHYQASLQSHVSDAVIAQDAKMRIQSWNQAAERIYGWRAEEVIGRPVDKVILTEGTAEEHQHHLQQLQEKGWWRGEVVQHRKDGTQLRVLQSITILKDEKEQPYGAVTVNHDVTGLHEAMEKEKELVKLRARMSAVEQERELAELKERFVFMASHEFRTPIAVIFAIAETLLAYRQRMNDEQVDERLKKICKQLRYLESMVDDVLELATLQAHKGDFTPTLHDFDAFCASVVDEYQNRTDLAHPINYQCVIASPTTPKAPIWFDQRLIRQVIDNLLSNAIKYSPGEKAVEVTLTFDADAVILSIQDQGIGIPDAELKHLFKPFHRAANAETIHGTGLGLTIVKEAIDLHNGEIAVESELNVGTLFSVKLPWQQSKREVAAPAEISVNNRAIP